MLPCLRLKSACLPQVWKILTAYERLPEFLPNLLLCERLQPPEHTGNSSRVKRIRQVGSSGMSCSGGCSAVVQSGFGRARSQKPCSVPIASLVPKVLAAPRLRLQSLSAQSEDRHTSLWHRVESWCSCSRQRLADTLAACWADTEGTSALNPAKNLPCCLPAGWL